MASDTPYSCEMVFHEQLYVTIFTFFTSEFTRGQKIQNSASHAIQFSGFGPQPGPCRHVSIHKGNKICRSVDNGEQKSAYLYIFGSQGRINCGAQQLERHLESLRTRKEHLSVTVGYVYKFMHVCTRLSLFCYVPI